VTSKVCYINRDEILTQNLIETLCSPRKNEEEYNHVMLSRNSTERLILERFFKNINVFIYRKLSKLILESNFLLMSLNTISNKILKDFKYLIDFKIRNSIV